MSTYPRAYHPWTNGLVERMNKTLKLATVDKYYYNNYNSLQKHLDMFIKAYNFAKHLRSLKGNTPFEVLCFFIISIRRYISLILFISLWDHTGRYTQITLAYCQGNVFLLRTIVKASVMAAHIDWAFAWFFPASPKAVPCAGEVRTMGRPAVKFTPPP